jgi:soluble lytic murein transglycosylase-like protein
MQIKLNTARMFNPKITQEQLRDPKTNFTYAAKYLRYQYDRYQDWGMAVAAFNAGSFRESKKVADCPRNLVYLNGVKAKLKEDIQHLLACGKDKPIEIDLLIHNLITN